MFFIKAGGLQMNKYVNRYSFLLMLFIGTGIQLVSAQKYSISGDTIFVNADVEVRIRFPSLPSSFYTVPSNAPYNFKTVGKGFTITSKSGNTKPATLFVIEGKRNHRFILAFKKKIDYSNEDDIDYDYSSKKKLKRHIKQEARNRS